MICWVVKVGVVVAVSDALFSAIGAPIVMSALCSASVVAAPAAGTVSGAVKLIVNCDCSVTSAVLSSVATRVAVIWLLAPGSPAKMLSTTVVPGVPLPSRSATVPTVRNLRVEQQAAGLAVGRGQVGAALEVEGGLAGHLDLAAVAAVRPPPRAFTWPK